MLIKLNLQLSNSFLFHMQLANNFLFHKFLIDLKYYKQMSMSNLWLNSEIKVNKRYNLFPKQECPAGMLILTVRILCWDFAPSGSKRYPCNATICFNIRTDDYKVLQCYAEFLSECFLFYSPPFLSW